MLLTYLRPRADLIDYVRAYYYFETPDETEQPLCAELGNIRVLLRGGGWVTPPNGPAYRTTDAFLIGPTMGAYSIRCEAGTRVFGVGIRPRGWGVMMGVSAAELTDRIVDLTAIAGRVAGGAIGRIGEAKTLREMARAADDYFADLVEARLQRACAYPEALEHWLRDPGDLDIDRLLEMSDKSQRQIDRLAQTYFGASPKRLQRKYRTLRAADRMRNGAANWRDAAGVSIYDQSHFIREFRNFIGVTPGQFAAQEAALIKQVQKSRRVRGAAVNLAEI
ncbi:MAG: AraC family transcriptional regulator [Pseudomonadota bacterium]